MTAQALLGDSRDERAFLRSLAWKLRLWLVGLPAGVGLATLRSVLKLWIGIPPSRSGVRSAGNGPAMRASVLGIFFWDDVARLGEFVRASTRLTHTDPRAERGAMAIAVAARYGSMHDRETFRPAEAVKEIRTIFPADDREAHDWLAPLGRAAEGSFDFDRFCSEFRGDAGISGYMYQTVPSVLGAWLAAPFDFRQGMERVIHQGGDADTTAAIFGSIAGATAGRRGIPEEWIRGVIEFPRTTGWVRKLAGALYRKSVGKETVEPLRLWWPLLVPRNLLFLGTVLGHGARRLLPPY